MMRSLLDIALPRHEVLIGEQKANMPGARRMTFSESLAPRSVAALERGKAAEAIGISLELLPARRIGLGEIADRDNN